MKAGLGDPHGSDLRWMTFDRHGNCSPSLSPNGEKLLVPSDREEDSQLGQKPVDGRNRKCPF